MMALELLDTKWAGVIQPDPDSAQAGDVETEHILAPADGPRRTVTCSGSASITRAPKPPTTATCRKPPWPASTSPGSYQAEAGDSVTRPLPARVTDHTPDRGAT